MSSRSLRLSPGRISLFACVLMAFGLLLWARLILVTGTPRTAIADPAGVPSQATVEAGPDTAAGHP
jgi:hypothetical protein